MTSLRLVSSSGAPKGASPSRLPPVARDAARPFRLWDEGGKANVRWRFYGSLRKAHDAAIVNVRWEGVGTSWTVYDARTHRTFATYTRKVSGVDFSPH